MYISFPQFIYISFYEILFDVPFSIYIQRCNNQRPKLNRIRALFNRTDSDMDVIFFFRFTSNLLINSQKTLMEKYLDETAIEGSKGRLLGTITLTNRMLKAPLKIESQLR